MVTLVKHEWHQVDSQFAFELDDSILSEIYPDLDEVQVAALLVQIESGEIDIDDLMNDACEQGVDIEWDRQYDDWWTDRKGGYEVTYELGDESSWHAAPEKELPTHKCTKCRWQGSRYETLTKYCRADGTAIENYFESDEEADSSVEVCPMCDGDLELTEAGRQEAEARLQRMKEIDEMFPDAEDEDMPER